MAFSSIFTDYMGEGLASARPVSLSISPTALGLYYAIDTQVLSLWDGTTWQTSATASSEPVNIQAGTTYAVANADQGHIVIANNASAVGWGLPQAGGGGEFLDGWWADISVLNAGTLTITPVTSTIDGAASLVVAPSQGVRIVSDGTNYYTQRGMGSTGGGGTVTEVVAGPGLDGGTITATGTVSLGTIAANAILGNDGTIGAVPSGMIVGAGMTLAAGTIVADWNVGVVGTLDTGLTLTAGTLTPDWRGGAVDTIGAGLTLAAGTLEATAGGGGTVTQIDTGAGLTGGPITTTGTIIADWNGGTVSAIGAGLTLAAGTLSTPAINAGEVLANLGTAAASATGNSLSLVMDNAIGTVWGDIVFRGTSSWVPLAPGVAGRVLQTGSIGVDPSWKAEAYIVGGFSGTGTIVADQVLLVHQVAAAVTFPANFGAVGNGTASQGGSLTNAIGSTTISVDRCLAANDPTNNANWSAIGSMVFGAGGHTITFATAGGMAQTLAAGDYLRWKGPNPADGALTGIFASLAGER